MNLIYLLVGIGILLIIFLMALVYLMATDGKTRKKKRKENPVDLAKQLQAYVDKSQHLEKLVQSLRQEIAGLEKSQLNKDKELTIERAKVKKLQEKISQEKEWHQREQDTIDKRGKENQLLKAEVLKAEDQFAKEHSQLLKLNQEVKELQSKVEGLTEQKRTADFQLAQVEARTESQRKEIVELKKENLSLIKKKEDVTWIAKPEYDRVKQLLEEKEKELNRQKRES